MNTLTRFSPIRHRIRFGTPALLDDWLHESGMGSFWGEPDLAPRISLDVNEHENAFHVTAEIPGVDKDDIDISIQGNQLSISAERKRESDTDGTKEILTERAWGKSFRSIALPADIDGDRTQAQYDKGLLKLTLPKKPNGNVRRIAVS